MHPAPAIQYALQLYKLYHLGPLIPQALLYVCQLYKHSVLYA